MSFRMTAQSFAAGLVLFAQITLFAGCGEDAPPPAPAPAPTPPTAEAWFLLVPGRTSDYKITRLGVGERYLRATLGEPEMFFGRLAYPWVWSEIPGQVPDTSLVGLRQYFALRDDGALEFVGAQNNGFMSRTDPPLRQLLADPEPGSTWEDSVFFESFLPGGSPFFEDTQLHVWQTSALTPLDLPAGSFDALRTTVEVTSLPEPAALAGRASRASRAVHAGRAIGPDEREALAREFAARGVSAALQELEILKGFWFAREHGVVARDYPSGSGPTNTNARTFELMAEGTGPLPPAIPQTP